MTRAPAREHLLRSVRHFHRHLERGVVLENRDRLLVDQRPRVGLVEHVVKTRSGGSLASDDGPMDRRAAAVLRQQRAMHVQRAALRHVEPRGTEHVPIVKREHEIRPGAAPFGNALEGVGIVRGLDLEPVRVGQFLDAPEPAALVRIVGMRDEKRDLHILRQQLADAADSDLAVGEHHRTGHGRMSGTASTAGSRSAPPSSSTASMM
jgi:hypothetical protein